MNRNKLRFTTPIPPSSNAYLGKCIIYVNNKPTIRIYPTEMAKRYKTYTIRAIQRAVKEQGWELLDKKNTYVYCEIVAYIPHKKRDTDNLLKCLLDAIKETDVVYDDCMIIPQIINTYIDKENPRLEICLRESSKKGVFKDQAQLDDFKETFCKNCTRYNKNCSILKKSLENKILPEIDYEIFNCSAFKQKKA